MASGHEISGQLPYLRRFARAVTGSQRNGDACLLATLEAIKSDPDALREGPSVRASLYRTFLRVWRSNPTPDDAQDSSLSPDERGARERLEAISPQPRIAFLLSALEGFDAVDIGAILGVQRVDADALLDEAGRDIARQLRTDVLIIEDEPLIALDLKMLLEELGHRITGIARTHKEAVKAAQATPPGLILADIQLADGSSGLEAVNQILLSFEAPVIFVTAYPERFLTGKPPEPAFLITKPISVDSLKAVVSQALFFNRKSHRAPSA